MDTQEAKILKEIKKMATAGQHQAAKIMAKDVSRMRMQKN
jgi:phosphatidate phosphatase PAH1